jgi:uncharacterized protein YjbI with pentapeptide repeats
MRTSSTNSNCSGTTLQGRKFSNQNLRGKNFLRTRTKLTNLWFWILLIFNCLLSALSGFTAAAGFSLVLNLFLFEEFSLEKLLSGLLELIIIVFSLFAFAWRGILYGFGITILIFILGLLLCIILLRDFTEVGIVLFISIGTISLLMISLAAASVSITSMSTLIRLKTFAVFKNLVLSSLVAVSLIDTRVILIVVPISVLGSYVAYTSLAQNEKYSWMKDMVIALVVLGGISFKQANLAEANFSDSILSYTDFRDANLTRTRWSNVRGLEFARLGSTYLANPRIRQLVVTCNGQGQNFDGLDLTGVNLQDAHLQEASFIGANLNQSNLRGADLTGAYLKQTQLDGADLTGATLTGAYIEDWGITSTTKLENVQCEYVYMRVRTKENDNPLRKPDNWGQIFAEGEFADFIQPFFDTLDLYHSQDVDPRAISIALRNLSANHPDEDLQFVAMERRGNNGLNLRFTTTPGADKSELSHEYFSSYTKIKNELPIAVQMQLAEQNAEIRTLKGTIEQFIQTGTHQYTIQSETIQVIQGELVVTENRGININAGDSANISGLVSGDGVVNLGTISGNVTNAINQLPDPSESEQPNLKALLTQLQQAIEADRNLPDPDKSDLLEQVQALTEAKQTEEPTKREGITRKAMKMFDATLKSLPDTAKIVEACTKLLPLILKALGLPA